MLKQELYCALARFTSFAHTSTMPQKTPRGNAAELITPPLAKLERADAARFHRHSQHWDDFG
jgi:hypothetical protein